MLLCPLCAHAMRTVERQGIELDHCPECGGFWLDPGELDALVQQEALAALVHGQQTVREARGSREYDRVAATASPEEDFSGRGYYDLTPPTSAPVAPAGAAVCFSRGRNCGAPVARA